VCGDGKRTAVTAARVAAPRPGTQKWYFKSGPAITQANKLSDQFVPLQLAAGTLHYMAPEVVKNPLKDHPDDFKNDIRYHYNVVVDSWAVGCLAYELLAGFPPFSANTQQQVVHNINNMQVQYTKKMSEDAIDFIRSALEKIPHARATSTELIKHPWVTQHMVRVHVWLAHCVTPPQCCTTDCYSVTYFRKGFSGSVHDLCHQWLIW
jgi:serine/threonine protein kinase